MSALAAIIVPALIPAVSDVVRGIIAKFTGGAGAVPQNVDEEIRLMEAKTKNLQALAELDKPSGTISQWVADLRASFRYVAAGVVVLAAVSTLYVPVPIEAADLAWQAAQSAWSFIFGERLYMYLKRGK
jgi:hypothetical protein